MGKLFLIRVFLPATIVLITAFFIYSNITVFSGQLVLLMLAAYVFFLLAGLALLILNHYLFNRIAKIFGIKNSGDTVSAILTGYVLYMLIASLVNGVKSKDYSDIWLQVIFIAVNILIVVFSRTKRKGTAATTPPVWAHKSTYSVGGLHNVGYAPGTDYLLVLSSQGEGIFNCVTGERIARKYNDENWFDELNQQTLTIKGFDVLQEMDVVTSGLYGGDNLPKTTTDGWQLIISAPAPDDELFQQFMERSIYLLSPGGAKIFVGKDGACELRAFGFSETGNSFIIALSCNLEIWTRQPLKS